MNDYELDLKRGEVETFEHWKEKKKNPFEALAEFYNEQVKKQDEAGYADVLKKSTELFFRDVNSYVDTPVHFENIEYLDGYFIFGHGSNSIIQFHIKECPEWLFGIWWMIPDGSNPDQKYINGDFFAQHEETIDKFKPSASEISCCITARPYNDDESDCTCWKAAKYINFIRNEPYLAFCRHYHGWDYNEEYHTREEAETEYKEWRNERDNETKYTSFLNEKFLSFVRENVLPLFTNSEIEDRGENWSPRYQVVAPLRDNKSIVKKSGTYGWFADDDERGKKIMEEYYSLREECKKIGEEHEVLWFTPINESITFYEE